MLFNSEIFLFYFLPVFGVLYLFLKPLRNSILLAASLLFYAWGEAEYTLIMLFSIAMNYVFAHRIHDSKGTSKQWFGVCVVLNLSLLVFFKYANFIADSLRSALPDTVSGAVPVLDVHLPLGISFFTFQAISYVFDVYKKTVKPERSIINLGLYISCFPQLIAGPIVRYKTIASEIKGRVLTLDKISLGLQYFIIGLAQKTLIANTVAVGADNIFAIPTEFLTPLMAWEGAILYTIQIYFDFSGYSNMAIGLGLILGFHFPKNFNFPYTAQSITDFWRRWHMTLSAWFRDYLYIPLGGNRRGDIRTSVNLFAVFFLCGLWHGAAWNFIVWGLYHGAFLSLEKLKIIPVHLLWRPLRHIYTMLVIVFGWVIFRADTMGQASEYMLKMLSIGPSPELDGLIEMSKANMMIAIVAAIIFSTPYVLNAIERQDQTVHHPDMMKVSPVPNIIRSAILIGLLAVCCSHIVSGAYNPFIYFRF